MSADLSGVPYEDLVSEMIRRLGDDPARDGMKKTPARVARAMEFLTQGYGRTAEEVLGSSLGILLDNDDYREQEGLLYQSIEQHHRLDVELKCRHKNGDPIWVELNLAPVFDELGFEAGGALGQMSATVGIVVAVVSGVALIQYGARRGMTTQINVSRMAEDRPDLPALIPDGDRRPGMYGTVRSGVIDALTLHVAVTALAVLIGWVLLHAVRGIHGSLAAFPLFPLAMIGGIVVQIVVGNTPGV